MSATATEHAFDVYAEETPTEIHHRDCERTPESHRTGDCRAHVVQRPENYELGGERICTCCPCLDPILGSDR